MKEEKAVAERRRKERDEQHLYLSVGVVTENNFQAYQGFDLTMWDDSAGPEATPKMHRVLRTSTIGDFTKALAETMQLPPEQLRLWVMVNRQNKTVRPDTPIAESDMTIDEAYTKYSARDKTFRIWVEQASQSEDGNAVWPEYQATNNSNPPILLFLKYFDAEAQSLRGVGHVYIKKQARVADLLPMIEKLMGWPSSSSHPNHGLTNGNTVSPPNLVLYEEIKHSMIEPMKPKQTMFQSEIQDGDIICFQKQLTEQEIAAISQAGGYVDAREFYDYLLNKKTVIFSPKIGTDDEKDMFKLDLNKKMSYDQLAAKVAEHLKVDPTHLRFSTVNSTTGKAKLPIKKNVNQTLYQILSPQFGTYANSNQRDDALYYEVLDMSLSEWETKRTMKVTLVTEGVTKEVSILQRIDGT